MSIPTNITRDHILLALEAIDEKGYDSKNESTKFDLLFNDKRYPPKVVIKEANYIANNYELIHFSGGDSSNDFLIALGFSIVLKGTEQIVGLKYANNQRLDERQQNEQSNEPVKLHLDQELIEANRITNTEKEQLIKSRIGQSNFKKGLIERECKCKLCGVTNERFLIASHIKPWSDATNEERLDLDNGFLLCPNHDALFDKGFITFTEKGNIVISKQIDDITMLF